MTLVILLFLLLISSKYYGYIKTLSGRMWQNVEFPSSAENTHNGKIQQIVCRRSRITLGRKIYIIYFQFWIKEIF